MGTPMTDLITRARKEWCETHVAKDGAPDGHAWQYMQPCPPEVVAALLDVLDEVFRADSCVSCFGHRVYKHRPGCLVKQAEATITRALGAQKP